MYRVVLPIIVSIVIIGLIILPQVTNVMGHGSVDQSFTGPFNIATTIWTGIANFQPIGQEFTPSTSDLVAVDIIVDDTFNANPPGSVDTITVTIWSGSIGGVMVGQKSQQVTTIGDPFNPQTIHFNFNSLLTLTPGNTYVLQASSTQNFFGWKGHGTVGVDLYTGGKAIVGGIQSQSDFAFVTYFGPTVHIDFVVDGTDAIFLAGRDDIIIPPLGQPFPSLPRHGFVAPDFEQETFPNFIPITGGDIIGFAEPPTGGVNFLNGAGPPFTGPEGFGGTSNLLPLGGISGYLGTPAGLAGVFLDDNNLALETPPPTLDFSTVASRDFVILQPQLRQDQQMVLVLTDHLRPMRIMMVNIWLESSSLMMPILTGF